MDNSIKLERELSALLSFAGTDDAEKIGTMCRAFCGKFRIFECAAQTVDAILGNGERVYPFLSLAAELAVRRVTEEYKPGKKYSRAEVEKLITALFVGYKEEVVYVVSFDKALKL